ncbi:MAG: hypothetical protein IJ516_05790 [Phascolarctobacterium sp.]|nr:hypothetical protein [Phascolarctobacterium sp.]
MLNKAIAKLDAELEALKKKNDYTLDACLAIGEYLIQYVTDNPDTAERFLQKGKTIKGSYKAMENEARNRKRGTCVYISEREGFKIVLGYFDIAGGASEAGRNVAGNVSEMPKKEAVALDLDLDDLL